MKYKRIISVFILLLLLLVTMPFIGTPALAKGSYESLTVPDVRSNEVNELGVIFARFIGGGLEKSDYAIFRLPTGFIWNTADLGSDEKEASAAYQTTDQWNIVTYNSDYVRYGTSNYVLVPREYSGNDNGLYKGSTPVLQFSRLNDREVIMRIIDEPNPSQDCYFYIYANRVYIADDYSGDISLVIDTSSGSGFDDENNIYNTIECKSLPNIFAGVPEQRIGQIVITEAAAGNITDGQTLTLKLPPGAKWVTLDEDSNSNLNLSASTRDDGRTAEFRFTGKSSAASSLTLKDMQVVLKPGTTGDLKVEVGGTASLTGELAVAKSIPPVAVFTAGQTEFKISGVKKTIDVAPYIKDDRIYLPVRYFAQATGVADSDIIWSPGDQSVEIRKGGGVVKLTIGSKIIYVNRVPTLMDVAPEIVDPGRIMLPLRWIAQAFEYDVYWDPGTRQAYILSSNN